MKNLTSRRNIISGFIISARKKTYFNTKRTVKTEQIIITLKSKGGGG